MAGLVRYGKILRALAHPKRKLEGGVHLLFEQYNMTLCHRDYLMAMFCLLSLRPTHQGLAVMLWTYINKSQIEGEHVKDYIYRFAEYAYDETTYSTTFEEKTKALSVALRRKKNPAYRGSIVAINIKTKEEVILVGVEEMRALGFHPSQVYNCINCSGSPHTHRGYVFVRLIEE